MGHQMTSEYVKMCVAQYYVYKRQSLMVTFERSLDYIHIPDVLVVMSNRKLVEIEVKVSLSDFKADAKKHIWYMRDRHPDKYMPYMFYYAVPSKLVDKVKDLVRPDCGLLEVCSPDEHKGSGYKYVSPPAERVMVKKRAPIHKRSGLTDRQLLQMAHKQAVTVCALMEYRYSRSKYCQDN